jgi:hypothetical protein
MLLTSDTRPEIQSSLARGDTPLAHHAVRDSPPGCVACGADQRAGRAQLPQWLWAAYPGVDAAAIAVLPEDA